MVDMPDRQMILTQYLVFNQKKQQALKKCLLFSVGKTFSGQDAYPGIFMLMLVKEALHSSANTPMWAPSIEWVMRELSAL